MPNIKSSTDLRNNYSKLELYHQLDEGRAAVRAGKKRPLGEVMKDIKKGIADGAI